MREQGHRLGSAGLAIPAAFVLALLVLTMTRQVPALVLWSYAAMSIIAFFVYWRDKVAATRDRRRTSEGALLGLAVLGGWPGACLARHLFRHKTRKQPFRSYFWIAVAVNCGVLVFVVAQLGRGPG